MRTSWNSTEHGRHQRWWTGCGLGQVLETPPAAVWQQEITTHDGHHQFDDQKSGSRAAQWLAPPARSPGSGTQPSDVNKLMKQFTQMEKKDDEQTRPRWHEGHDARHERHGMGAMGVALAAACHSS
jgi:hypothetical protein